MQGSCTESRVEPSLASATPRGGRSQHAAAPSGGALATMCVHALARRFKSATRASDYAQSQLPESWKPEGVNQRPGLLPGRGGRAATEVEHLVASVPGPPPTAAAPGAPLTLKFKPTACRLTPPPAVPLPPPSPRRRPRQPPRRRLPPHPRQHRRPRHPPRRP